MKTIPLQKFALLPLLGTLAISAGPVATPQEQKPTAVPTAQMCVMMDMGKPKVAGRPGTEQPQYHRTIGAIAEGPDGSFVTSTADGGAANRGMIFQVNRDGTWDPWYTFPSAKESPRGGAHPVSGLTKGSDGAWYGTTVGGGQFGTGTIFRITGKNQLQPLHDFRNGNAYGYRGCFKNCKWTPQDTANMLPGYPIGPPIDDGTGTFYGVTTVANNFSTGALYRFTKPGGDWHFETICIFDARLLRNPRLAEFACGEKGSQPGGLILGQDPNRQPMLYGVLRRDPGYIFSATPGRKPKVLHSFSPMVNPEPISITQGSDGILYGTTYRGGTRGRGTVYKFDPSQDFRTTLSSFNGAEPGSTIGYSPSAGLVEHRDGKGNAFLYGATRYGGTGNRGTLFRIPRDGGPMAIIHNFDLVGSGWQPISTPVLRGDTLFGLTYDGGMHRGGTFYRLTGPDLPTSTVAPTRMTAGFEQARSKTQPGGQDFVVVRTHVEASQVDFEKPVDDGHLKDGVSVSLRCRNPQLIQFISRDILKGGVFHKGTFTPTVGEPYDYSEFEDEEKRFWKHDGGTSEDPYYANGPRAGRAWEGPVGGRLVLRIYDKPTFPVAAPAQNEVYRARTRIYAICNCEVKWSLRWSTDLRYDPANPQVGKRVWEDKADPNRFIINEIPASAQADTLKWINAHLRPGTRPAP